MLGFNYSVDVLCVIPMLKHREEVNLIVLNPNHNVYVFNKDFVNQDVYAIKLI